MIAPAELTVRQFFTQYYLPDQLIEKSQATKSLYVTILNRLETYANRDIFLSELTDSTIASCMAWTLANGGSPATANQTRAHLLAICRYAIKKKKIRKREPDVRKLTELKRKPRAWRLKEFTRILDAARKAEGVVVDPKTGRGIRAGLWWPALLLTLYDSGLRISATMALEWRDLDWDEGAIWVRPEIQKQGAEQYLDLSAETLEALKAIREPARVLIFCWPFDHSGPQWPVLNKRYREILVAAGMPTGRRDLFHKVRRTNASYLKANGGDPTERLGHSTHKVTDRYLDPSICRKARQADLLPRPEPPQQKTQPRFTVEPAPPIGPAPGDASAWINEATTLDPPPPRTRQRELF